MSEEKKSHLMEGLIFGGLIGLAAGLIFAPVAGDTTRSKIKEVLNDLDLGEVVDRVSEAFNEGIVEAKKVSEEITS